MSLGQSDVRRCIDLVALAAAAAHNVYFVRSLASSPPVSPREMEGCTTSCASEERVEGGLLTLPTHLIARAAVAALRLHQAHADTLEDEAAVLQWRKRDPRRHAQRRRHV